jgi:hypothetical protein
MSAPVCRSRSTRLAKPSSAASTFVEGFGVWRVGAQEKQAFVKAYQRFCVCKIALRQTCHEARGSRPAPLIEIAAGLFELR